MPPKPPLLHTLLAAESLHLTNQLTSIQALLPTQSQLFSTHRPANGSLTLRAPAVFGRKLNHTINFGTAGPVTKQDLHDLEEIYTSTTDESTTGGGVKPEIDMCEYADASAFALLSEKGSGYEVTGTIETFCRRLTTDPTLTESTLELEQSSTSNDEVKVHTLSDLNLFISTSVQGFLSGGRSVELLTLLAESAARREDTTLFVAKVRGEVAGAAGMAVLDVEEGSRSGCKVANLYIDSTLPAHRQKGVHRALLLARLQAAQAAGCEVAMASARAASGSARNIEKAGLEKMFTSTTFSQRS